MMLARAGCLACLLLLVWAGKAQTPYLQPIQFPYQIPTKVIYDMLIDTQGQLLLGTDKGLFRFNGKNAVAIPFQQARQLDFTHLKQDQKGRIWGMNFAKQVFYLERDTLRPFPLQVADSEGGLINYDFTQNQLWVLTSGAVSSYDLRTFKKLFTFQYTEGFSIMCVFENKAYIATNKKFFIFQEDHSHTTEDTQTGYEVSFIRVGKELYGMNRRELDAKDKRVSFKWQAGKRVALPDMDLPTHIFVHHQVIADARIWLCTRQGAYIFEPETGKSRLIFPDKNITDVVQDYQGNYWVSTLNEGLWFCPSLQNTAFQLPVAMQMKHTLASVYVFDQNLYLGTTLGDLLRVPILSKSTQLPLLGEAKFSFNASHSEVRRVAFQPELGFFAVGKGVYDKFGKPLWELSLVKDACFYEFQGEKAVIIATAHGFRILSVSLKRLKHLSKLVEQYVHIDKPHYLYRNQKNQRAYSVAVSTKQEKFWVGYDNALLMYDFAGTARVIQTATQEPIIASSLAVDEQERLWAGTFQQGLFVWGNDRIIAHFEAGKHLKNNHIRKLVSRAGKVWVSTDAEIGYIDLETLTFTDLLAQSGLAGSFAYKDFYPDEQGVWIVLSHSIIFVPNLPAQRAQTLRLLPIRKTNNASFQVQALHYKNPSKVQLKYRLKGIDPAWQTIPEPETNIIYSHLRKGNYVLEVFAEDAITHLKSPLRTLNFQIPALWWETWWFWILMFLMVASGVCGLAYLAIERNRKKHLIKEQLWISQIKALQSQMNPHFLYNILNTVQGLVYSDRRGEASEVLGNFSDLMRNTLQISEKPYISLQEELKLLNLYIDLEKMRFETGLFCEIIADLPPEVLAMQIPSMLIQPFVENAFKHGLMHKKGEKILTLTFSQKAPCLHITIDDNGIGRARAQEIRQRQPHTSTGFAMSATAQRVALLNKINQERIKIEVVDKLSPALEPVGTTVHIYIRF